MNQMTRLYIEAKLQELGEFIKKNCEHIEEYKKMIKTLEEHNRELLEGAGQLRVDLEKEKIG